MSSVRSLCDSAGGRRFVLTVGSGAVCSVLLWFGKLTSGDFSLIIVATVATYISGNTYQKVRSPRGESAAD